VPGLPSLCRASSLLLTIRTMPGGDSTGRFRVSRPYRTFAPNAITGLQTRRLSEETDGTLPRVPQVTTPLSDATVTQRRRTVLVDTASADRLRASPAHIHRTLIQQTPEPVTNARLPGLPGGERETATPHERPRRLAVERGASPTNKLRPSRAARRHSNYLDAERCGTETGRLSAIPSTEGSGNGPFRR